SGEDLDDHIHRADPCGAGHGHQPLAPAERGDGAAPPCRPGGGAVNAWPVVLVHGTRTSATQWDRQLPSLRAAGHTSHAIDLPGHGTRRAEPFELDTAIEAIAAAVREAAPQRVHLIGSSLGGMLAIHAAARGIDHLGSLTVCGGAVQPGRASARLYGRMIELTDHLPGISAEGRGPLLTWILGPEGARAYLRGGRADASVVRPTMEALASLDLLDDLRLIRVPVTFLHGRTTSCACRRSSSPRPPRGGGWRCSRTATTWSTSTAPTGSTTTCCACWPGRNGIGEAGRRGSGRRLGPCTPPPCASASCRAASPPASCSAGGPTAGPPASSRSRCRCPRSRPRSPRARWTCASCACRWRPRTCTWSRCGRSAPPSWWATRTCSACSRRSAPMTSRARPRSRRNIPMTPGTGWRSSPPASATPGCPCHWPVCTTARMPCTGPRPTPHPPASPWPGRAP